MELTVSVTIDGVKTGLCVDISSQALPPSSVDDIDPPSAGCSAVDLLEGAILPILPEVTRRLVEVNHLISGSLVGSFVASARESL